MAEGRRFIPGHNMRLNHYPSAGYDDAAGVYVKLDRKRMRRLNGEAINQGVSKSDILVDALDLYWRFIGEDGD